MRIFSTLLAFCVDAPPTLIRSRYGGVAIDIGFVQRPIAVHNLPRVIGGMRPRGLRSFGVACRGQADGGIQGRKGIGEPVCLAGVDLGSAVQLGVSYVVFAVGNNVTLGVGLASLPCRLDAGDFKSLFVGQ